MRSWVVSAFVSLLAVSGLAGTTGSKPPEPKPTAVKPPVFGAELELVKVTVTVRDAHGNVVNDLKPEDFTISEDGRPQPLGFFARAFDPEGGEAHDRALSLDLGMIIDVSSSMRKVWGLSQQAAIRFLESVPRAHDLLTLLVDGDIRLSRYDSTEQQGLFDQIMEAHPTTKGSLSDANNRTAIYDAVSVYLSRVAEGSGRKVAVLFTDGVDTSSTTSLPELVNMVRGSSVAVYAIGFSGENGGVKGEGALNRLANVSGGAAYFPSSYRDLPGIYDRILADLSGQYVLGFTPVNDARDGKFRKIKVMARGASLKVQCREGYVAPSASRAAAQ